MKSVGKAACPESTAKARWVRLEVVSEADGRLGTMSGAVETGEPREVPCGRAID